jgi:hypothetical protein
MAVDGCELTACADATGLYGGAERLPSIAFNTRDHKQVGMRVVTLRWSLTPFTVTHLFMWTV